MDLASRLYELRKGKNLSQEEIAERLNVSRQTVSKWETGQSVPDFDKIVPLCELYTISADELLTGKKYHSICEESSVFSIRRKKAFVISTSVFLYFLAVIWMIIGESISFISDSMLVGIFLFLCGISTTYLIYKLMSLPRDEDRKKRKENSKYKIFENIISSLFCFIYFLISFITMRWDITWMIWILYAIVIEIIHLLFELGVFKYEEE